MSKLVTVICDKEEGETFALTKAKDIAAHLNADVEVVRFLSQSCSDTTRQAATQTLGELVHSVFNEADSVTTQVATTDNIPEWVANHCIASDDNLVVKTGHRSESLFHTPADWELMRRLHCPLFISSHRKWRSLPNVLIALDPSSDKAEHQKLDAQALAWAQRWQATYECKLHAIYSIPFPAPLLALDTVEQFDYQRTHEPQAREKLNALLADCGMTNVTAHISAGAPRKIIPHTANELKADLVIMGSVGRGGVLGSLRGNTAEKVLHHLRTDMLVVKPAGVSL